MNAKKELLNAIKDRQIKCADIAHGYFLDDWDEINLKVNYSEKEYNHFLEKLDFDYDDGCGTQEVYGIVWLNDGTWLSRDVYDGSESWQHNDLPKVPSKLIQNYKTTASREIQLTEMQVLDLGFKLIKEYIHDEYVTQIFSNDVLYVEFTYERTGDQKITCELTIVDTDSTPLNNVSELKMLVAFFCGGVKNE